MTNKRGKSLDQYKSEIDFEAFHPGEFLRDEMHERGISIEMLCTQLMLLSYELDDICQCKANITGMIAVRLEKLWGVSAESWMNMQIAWDIQEARKRLML